MMTIESAKAELERLRGIAKEGGDLAQHKGEIAELYWAVCGKTIRDCNCRDKYKDALIEIYAKLQTKTDMELNTKARLVAGVVLFWDNTHYTNANLTDEVASAFLAKFPQRKDWFAVLPSEAKEETPEKGAEIAPQEVKSESKPVAPKKKKTSKKGK